MTIIRYNKDGTQMTSQQMIQENNKVGYREGHWGTVFIGIWAILMGILAEIPIWGIALMAIVGMCVIELALWHIYKRDV